MTQLNELVKQVGKRTHGPRDFLIAENKDEIATWHLPVRENGTPVRELAATAWAALFSPDGYRGKKYDGSGVELAKADLRALFEAENWSIPNVVELAEMAQYIPYSVTSFADLDAVYEARELADANLTLAEQFKELVTNIFYDSNIANKKLAVSALTEEFIARIRDPQLPQPPSAISDEDDASALPIENEQAPASPNLFAESGSAVQLLESDGGDALIMEAVVIEPGLGNKRDGHYYSAALLREHAHVFTGVKMYATDHKAAEKSERTEVSEILECPVRFTETGAPVARVGVYDPLFAKKVRNRAKLGTLANLQCSILASGTAKPGVIAGQNVKIVESINVAHSVDWVTRAGAGGRAINLVEAEMVPKKENELEELDQEESAAVLTDVIIEEAQQTEQTEQTEAAPAPAPDATPATPEAAIVPGVVLGEIAHRLGETSLPSKSIAKLVVENYGDMAALDAAIEAEIAELRAAGSGRPFALTESAAPAPVTVSEADAKKDAVLEKWGFSTSPGTSGS